jgi:alpha-tubulin suppressor-like RCC1 family protein
MGISAGSVRNFRNVGYDDELIKLDIILSTKEEANGFTDFFVNYIQGSAQVFYYKNNFTGQESIVRCMHNNLAMGEAEGHPYSFSLLMRKEAPYTSSSLSLKYDVQEGEVVTAVVIGPCRGFFTMVMIPTNSRRLYGSGSNSNGQLGLGSTSSFKRFESVGVDTDWVTGAGGELHSHVINESGDLFSSGENSLGQLGLGDTIDRNLFTQVGVDSWLQVSSGSEFTVAIKTDGTLWAWGANGSGQLGQGGYDASSHSSPLQVGTFSNWVDVECGTQFFIVRNEDGELWGCGEDEYGQLGQGATQTRRVLLVKIGSDTDWDLFAAGWMHTVAIKTDGTLWAWGANFRGELGDGTTIAKYSPVQIGTGTWKALAAGACFDSGGPDFYELGRTHGIKTDGTLWAWGSNESYELGIGSSDTNPHASPILIDSDTDWKQVSTARTVGIAVKGSNEIWGWGANSSLELGTGDTAFVAVPTRTFLTAIQTSIVYDVEFF